MPFCSNCGTEMGPTAKFCPSCGREAASGAAPRSQAPPGDEVYLGGFFGLAKKRGLAYFDDYGLFLTDRRLIILNRNEIPAHGIPWLSRMKDEIDLTVNAKPGDLDQFKKEAEILKEDIREVELKRPSEFIKGWLTVTTNSGGTTKLALMEGRGTGDFDYASQLLQKFLPGRLRLVGADAVSIKRSRRRDAVLYGMLVLIGLVLLLLLYTGVISLV